MNFYPEGGCGGGQVSVGGMGLLRRVALLSRSGTRAGSRLLALAHAVQLGSSPSDPERSPRRNKEGGSSLGQCTELWGARPPPLWSWHALPGLGTCTVVCRWACPVSDTQTPCRQGLCPALCCIVHAQHRVARILGRSSMSVDGSN